MVPDVDCSVSVQMERRATIFLAAVRAQLVGGVTSAINLVRMASSVSSVVLHVRVAMDPGVIT